MGNAFRRFCDLLDSMVMSAACLMVAVIVLILFAEISFRVVLGVPAPKSQDVAQMSLVWLTFLGSATAFRWHRHIQVDIQWAGSESLTRVLDVFGTVISAAAMIAIGWIIVEVAPFQLRLNATNLPISRFVYGYLPFSIACVLVVLFALERILLDAPNGSNGEMS